MLDALVPIVAITMVFGIPLSAIIGSYYYKIKKLQIESGLPGKNAALANQQLLAENNELRRRIENLETIAADPVMLTGLGNDAHLQQQIDLMADEMARLKKKLASLQVG